MERKITIGISFDFYPDTEHADMFTDENGEPTTPTTEQILATCKDLAFEDISRIVNRGELWESLMITEEEI